MIRPADLARAATAALTRRLPASLGLRPHWRRLNRLFNRLGATPEAAVPMKDGTTLLVDLRTRTQVDAFYRAEYDAPLLDAVLRLYDGAGVFLDVGANIGFYATAVAAHLRRRGTGGQVVCCEPLPGNCRRLTENLRRNGLEARCTLCPLGLSSEDQTLLLTLREDFEGGASTGNASIAIGPGYDAGFPQVPVTLTTLDALWPTLTVRGARIDFVKLDIEGHEDRFFQGATRTLAAHRPTILMEVNRTYYRARGVDMDQAMPPLLPPSYRIFRQGRPRWRPISSFADCPGLDNVLLVPGERVATAGYRELLEQGEAVTGASGALPPPTPAGSP